MVKYVGINKELGKDAIIADAKQYIEKEDIGTRALLNGSMKAMESAKRKLGESGRDVNYWRDVISACLEELGEEVYELDDGENRLLRAKVSTQDPLRFDFDKFKKALKEYYPDDWLRKLKDCTIMTIDPATVQLLFDEGELDIRVMRSSRTRKKSESTNVSRVVRPKPEELS